MTLGGAADLPACRPDERSKTNMGKTKDTRLTALVLEPGKSNISIEAQVEGEPELEFLQRLVGGWIEKIGTHEYDGCLGVDVYVDDEWRLKEQARPSTERATYQYAFFRGNEPGKGLLYEVGGPIVLVGVNTDSGEQIDMADVPGMLRYAIEIAREFRAIAKQVNAQAAAKVAE
jgi:hypothetical protein